MANYYLDNPDILFYMKHLDMDEMIRLKEENFEQAKEYAEAPRNGEDARENYHLVLSILGEICAEQIAPLAAEADESGAQFHNGQVTYAEPTQKAIKLLADAELMGFTLPRKYGGLNFPITIYSIATEIVSQADAGLQNIFGLQEIGATINDYADEDVRAEFLPEFSSGKVTGAMVLTEPDAGSDLQAVQLKATYDEAEDCWRLNGMKRFITNGNAEVALILARSEEGTTDGRGLSMFLYRKDDSVVVRRIENKLGIHASPTCELQYNNTKAILIGKRRMGLIRYVMALMNGARLGIACQGLGIAQAAYNEAYKYANEREQFKQKIIDFPAVHEMLVNMKTKIEAARVLTYETSLVVDMKKLLDEKLANDAESVDKEMRAQSKYYTALAAVLTPMAKLYATEIANQVSYDAIQIHGGTGYMREFNVERHYRDARITNIYEGTSQLQVVAAIGGVLTRTLDPEFDKLEAIIGDTELKPFLEITSHCRQLLNATIDFVKSKNDADFTSLHARRIVEMALELYNALLLLRYAQFSDHKKMIAQHYARDLRLKAEVHHRAIIEDDGLLNHKWREMLVD
ncbi:acyl-CoA dehydrogenase family protein [candidate division KSB1 bacterium]|nr:acyl-CoA dehydrogenase family protein [candidate division KSB1 bacterium]